MLDNGNNVPRMNLSLTAAERQRLDALARMLGVRPSRAVGISVQHTLASVRANEPLHLTEEQQGEPAEE
jgi:hypothetical protein